MESFLSIYILRRLASRQRQYLGLSTPRHRSQEKETSSYGPTIVRSLVPQVYHRHCLFQAPHDVALIIVDAQLLPDTGWSGIASYNIQYIVRCHLLRLELGRRGQQMLEICS